VTDPSNRPEAVIFVGIQGSGKSTFYQQRFGDTHVRINLDTLKTRAQEGQALRDCMTKRRSFVVDNTNPLPSDRERYVAPAREAGFRVVAYFFDSTMKDAIARNKLREGKQKVPVPAIAATLRKMQRPTKSEGFDALYEVKVAAGAGAEAFIVSEF
jgi:predicted kinase